MRKHDLITLVAVGTRVLSYHPLPSRSIVTKIAIALESRRTDRSHRIPNARASVPCRLTTIRTEKAPVETILAWFGLESDDLATNDDVLDRADYHRAAFDVSAAATLGVMEGTMEPIRDSWFLCLG